VVVVGTTVVEVLVVVELVEVTVETVSWIVVDVCGGAVVVVGTDV
jgi:hypothetical protein